jgi:DNA-binding NtrC family response regulator
MDGSDALVIRDTALVPVEWTTAIQMVAHASDVVLIRGEAGTGKDVVAQLIHAATGQGQCPFVKVNCATRPPDRLATQLFGHERHPDLGRRKIGAFELAQRGTLYLDDVGALPPTLHADVLCALQRDDGRAEAQSALGVECRVILATRQPLTGSACGIPPWQASALRVLDLQLPALRDRAAHVGPLARFFLARFNDWYGRDVRLSHNELALLEQYSWPGNVRELETLIRDLVVGPDPDRALRGVRSAVQQPRPSAIRWTA